MINPRDYMIKLQGKEYLPVAPRVVMFREAHPSGKLITKILSHTESLAVCEAEVYAGDGALLAVAQGSCTVKGFRDYLEKAGTKAVGRALSLAGFGTIQACDLDEGDTEGGKAVVDAPQPRPNGRVLDEKAIKERVIEAYKVDAKMASVIATRFVEMKRQAGKQMTEPDLAYILSNWDIREVKLRCIPADVASQYGNTFREISDMELDALMLLDGQVEIPDDPFKDD